MIQIAEPNAQPKTRRVSIAVNESIISSLEQMAEEIGVDRAQPIRRILKKEMELEQSAAKENVVEFKRIPTRAEFKELFRRSGKRADNVIPFPTC